MVRNDNQGMARRGEERDAMKKHEIKVGSTYVAKISGQITTVAILGPSPHGGWAARNLKTGREVHIKSAAKLRYEWKG